MGAIAWTSMPRDRRAAADPNGECSMWSAVQGWLQQAADSVGLPINVYPADPNERLSVLFNESENIGQLREEWKHFWEETDAPSHLTPERVDGGIYP
jgi:hypothetical protein